MKKVGIFFTTLCLLNFAKNSSAMEDVSSRLKNLVIAAYNGNEENCKAYLGLATDPNAYIAPDVHDIDTGNVKYELNALSAAALTKHNNIIDLVLNPPTEITLEESIDINEASPTEGFTPLFMAIFGNNLDGLKLLLTNGAKVNIAAKNTQDTPLMKAASSKAVGDNPEFVETLLEKEASPDTQNINGDTALSFAILNKNVLIAKALIPATDLKLGDKNGNTPLHIAASLGLDAIVKLLLEKGADFKAKNKSDKTALELAQKRGKTSTAQILTQAAEEVPSINPSTINTRPTTPSEPDLTENLHSLHQKLNALHTALS